MSAPHPQVVAVLERVAEAGIHAEGAALGAVAERRSDSQRAEEGKHVHGISPLATTLRDLYASGFRGMLSLELFNREYWKQDALQVAKTGLAKMREAVQKGLA